ncbi:MAG: DoxX family protein [Sulfurospirillaceae bacterium]|jgi:putative oxidoreductase|nr:DoxX family protein [Sulfurospirillaceae bacterium]MDD2826701.1 DoxX family protein [Sulfurospirillaceae bacterium]
MKCTLLNPLDKGQSIALLAVRFVLAYGFFAPAMTKWGNISGVAEWFGTLGIPFPTFNAYMAASTEAAGVVLLVIGLATRLIALPLMAVMLVAITTVHLQHGFSATDNGFEIPFYYLIFLFILATHGAGKISIDAWVHSKSCDDAV